MAFYRCKGAEGIVQMFYAISKRRRDLNAAEAKGYERGLVEGRKEGLAEWREERRVAGIVAVLDEAEARFREPGADPMAVIAQMRAELRNGAGR